jgi:xanthine dehydrogenase accessory factor
LEEGRAALETFRLDDDAAAVEGMVCGGAMEVLVHPIDPANTGTLTVWLGLLDKLREGLPVRLITSIDRMGETVEVGLGISYPEGANPGTLSMGIEEMEQLTGKNGLGGPTLIKEGEKSFFVQPVRLPERVFIFGAGHLAEALAPLCREVGFSPVVVDDRPEFADPARFPAAGKVFSVESFEGCFEKLEMDGESFVAAVTRGHAHDRMIVAQALRTDARYIGMVGSVRKREAVFQALLEEGFGPDDLRRVRCPMGLPIGALTPAEIAVSVVAEMIAVRAGKEVPHPEERTGRK